VGNFTTPSLKQLRQNALKALAERSSCSQQPNIGNNINQNQQQQHGLLLHHIAVPDIFVLHTIAEDARDATFMAASQTNCLEFVSPNVTPEKGVTRYVHDGTQGPACALAAPAATVVRNYFVDVPVRTTVTSSETGSITTTTTTQIGQTATHQLNLFQDLLSALSLSSTEEAAVGTISGDGGKRHYDHDLIVIRNGYTLSNDDKLQRLNQQIASYCTTKSREALLDLVCIGLHSHVEIPWHPPPPGNRKHRTWQVLLPRNNRHHVTQAYCSALSCGYSGGSLDFWAPMAQLVLDAQYEAVLWAAILEQAQNKGSGKVYLTFLGGGVFGNRTEWIEGAIARACVEVKHRIVDFMVANNTTLNVYVCHYGTRVDTEVVARIDRLITQQEDKYNSNT
jgi:hypothetical protein